MKRIIRQALTAFLSVFMICMTLTVPAYAKAKGTKDDPFIMTAGKVMRCTWNWENSGDGSEGIYNLLTIPADGCAKFTFSKPYESFGLYYGTYFITITDMSDNEVIRFRTVIDYKTTDPNISYKIGLKKGSYLLHIYCNVNYTYSDQIKCDASYKYTFTETPFYESEPNDSKITADPLKAGKYYGGEIGEAETPDFFSFTLKKGTIYQLKLKGEDDVASGGSTRLLSPSGKTKFLRTNESSFSDGARLWTFKADADGKYYFVLSNTRFVYPGEYKVCIAKAPADTLVTIDGIQYLTGTAGTIGTGWKQIAKKWYYFDKKGMAKGWRQISSKWYYFDEEGAMVTGWQQIAKKWYYFSSSGAMLTGWQKISKKWYYFASGGAMVTGWKQLSGKWYYFAKGGAMVTGKQTIGGKDYLFSSSGAMLKGWRKEGDFWFYYGSGGAMVKGKKMEISGKTYEFLNNGVMYDKNLVLKAANTFAGDMMGTPDDLVYAVTKTSLGMGGNSYSCLDPDLAHQIPSSKARAGDLIAYVDKVKGTLKQSGVYLGGYKSFQVVGYYGVIMDYRRMNYYDMPGYETQFWRIDAELIYP
ncbi:MAG: hypothetical protein K6G61_05795 [Solobacterium sp.]|nr:hypothetical protein [Solobacterium sp.]